MMPDPAIRAQMMSTDALAEYLDVPVGTVYQWNHHGTGPTPIKVGKHVRYRPADVERWLDGRVSARPATR
jgi:excisionase family DNA binding protein